MGGVLARVPIEDGSWSVMDSLIDSSSLTYDNIHGCNKSSRGCWTQSCGIQISMESLYYKAFLVVLAQ